MTYTNLDPEQRALALRYWRAEVSFADRAEITSAKAVQIRALARKYLCLPGWTIAGQARAISMIADPPGLAMPVSRADVNTPVLCVRTETLRSLMLLRTASVDYPPTLGAVADRYRRLHNVPLVSLALETDTTKTAYANNVVPPVELAQELESGTSKTDPSDSADPLVGAIRTIIDRAVQSSLDDIVDRMLSDALPTVVDRAIANRITRIVIEHTEPPARSIDLGLQHRLFPTLLSLVRAGVNVWIHGPAGAGKSYAVAQVARALDLPYYETGALLSKYDLIGFVDANGHLVSTDFRRAYETGGVYLFDELDASAPEAVVAFNSALAGDGMSFPDGRVARHPQFRALAGCNTIGAGATVQATARYVQDPTVRDRFSFLHWPIDPDLESALAGGNDKWLKVVRNVRQRVADQGVDAIITPRAVERGATLLRAGMSWTDVVDAELRRGLPDDVWTTLTEGVELCPPT